MFLLFTSMILSSDTALVTGGVAQYLDFEASALLKWQYFFPFSLAVMILLTT
jgi:hypothetical protein